MQSATLRLAMVQMLVRGGDKEWNIKHAQSLIDEAARHRADLIVLPEAMDVGWTHPISGATASWIPEGDTCTMLAEAARAHEVHICSGLIEREGSDLYNAAVLVGPAGDVLIKHRKIYELDIAHDLYCEGDGLHVRKTDLGRIGVMICADGLADRQAISRSLGFMGADIVISPCSWAVPADHDNEAAPYGQEWRDAYVPVARDFSMWMVGVSNVGWITAGPWEGMKCIGCSLAVDPDGREAAVGSYGADAEEIRYLDVELRERPAWGTRWTQVWSEKARNNDPR